jgi:hypothetical protein
LVDTDQSCPWNIVQCAIGICDDALETDCRDREKNNNARIALTACGACFIAPKPFAEVNSST